MALYSKAIKKLIPYGSEDPPIRPISVILHRAQAVGSLYKFFNGPSGGVESHFWISRTGIVEQYRDTGIQADANRSGNNYAISVETEGMDDEPWTAAQVTAIKDLLKWADATHTGISLQKATAYNGSGVGYHSMFSEWGVTACPGAGRKAQFTNVLLPWMKSLVAAPTPPAPAPTTAVKGKCATEVWRGNTICSHSKPKFERFAASTGSAILIRNINGSYSTYSLSSGTHWGGAMDAEMDGYSLSQGRFCETKARAQILLGYLRWWDGNHHLHILDPSCPNLSTEAKGQFEKFRKGLDALYYSTSVAGLPANSRKDTGDRTYASAILAEYDRVHKGITPPALPEENDMNLTDRVTLRTGGAVEYSSTYSTVEGILTSTNYYVLERSQTMIKEMAAQKVRDEAILAAVKGDDDTATIVAAIEASTTKMLNSIPAAVTAAMVEAPEANAEEIATLVLQKVGEALDPTP